MAQKYKLTYFNGRGLAEFCRLIFAQAGVPYEDVRLGTEEWAELKSSTPFCQIPILEFDGHVIAQSRAISRYLANQYKLAGSNAIEAAKIDMLVDAVYDVMLHVSTIRWEEDSEKKEQLEKKVMTEILPPSLKCFEKLLVSNNGGVGYFVGENISWADLAIASSLAHLHEKHGSVLEGHDLLKAFSERVLSLPNIKAWIEKRPVTDF